MSWVCAANLISALAEACKEKVGVDIVLHPRPKGEDGSAQINELLDIIRASADSPVLGALIKVRPLFSMHLSNSAVLETGAASH